MTEYTPFGEEWEKEMMKQRKKDLINEIKNLSEQLHYLRQLANFREDTRHYLVANDPRDVSIDETLRKLGYSNRLNIIEVALEKMSKPEFYKL